MTLSASLLAVKFDIALLLNLVLHLKTVLPAHLSVIKKIDAPIVALQRWLVVSKVLQEVSILQAATDYNKVIERFVAYEKTKRKDDKSILCVAAYLGFQQIVLEMLSSGAEVETFDDNGSSTSLLYACFQGHIDTVRVLLNHGAKIQLDDNRFFVHPQVVELLIQHGAVDRQNYPDILFYAAHNGHHTVVERLLEKGVNPNVANQSGETALCVAARLGHVNVI